MSYRLNYEECTAQELKYITRIASNSLPLSLCLSLFQLLAIFHSTKSEISNILKRKLSILVTEAKSKYPQGEQFIEMFSQFYLNICQCSSPNVGLEYIDKWTISTHEPNEDSFIYKIDIASRCLICTLISSKLADSGQSARENNFFAQDDMRDLDPMIFKKFIDNFMVSIKIYENKNSEIIDNPNHGSFPLIHLYKENYKYGLAYPQELVDIRFNTNFDLRKIEDKPFMLNKRNSCPIARPVPNQPSQPREIDYSDDKAVLINIVECLSKHLESTNTFNREIVDVISICIEKNRCAKGVQGLVQYLKRASLSLNQKKCSVCNEEFNENISTSHNNCEVCNRCMTKQDYGGRCPRCKQPYTHDDRNKLRLP